MQTPAERDSGKPHCEVISSAMVATAGFDPRSDEAELCREALQTTGTVTNVRRYLPLIYGFAQSEPLGSNKP